MSSGPPDVAVLLSRAREIADRLLFPAAQEVDQCERLPARNLQWLAEAGLLGLAVPREYGGAGAPGGAILDYLETIAGACGVTNFVQLQHLLGCLMIARGQNLSPKLEHLPAFARGERYLSVGFSQVRRPGPPMVRVEPDSGDWVFEGTVPWLTGWGLMHEAVLGGTLPDGRYIFALSPLVESPRMRASTPMRLCAASASSTVSLTLSVLRVPEARRIQTISPEDMAQRDAVGLPVGAAFSLGVARRAVRLLAELANQRQSQIQLSTERALEGEIQALRVELDSWMDRFEEPGYVENALRLRARAIELGVRCAHACVTASGGSANLLTHPAQRLMREAMLYTLTAQTRSLQDVTLERLATDYATLKTR